MADSEKWLRIGSKTINLDSVVAVEWHDGNVKIHFPSTSIQFTDNDARHVIVALVKRGIPHPDCGDAVGPPHRIG